MKTQEKKMYREIQMSALSGQIPAVGWWPVEPDSGSGSGAGPSTSSQHYTTRDLGETGRDVM